jgi:hypothetical protein
MPDGFGTRSRAAALLALCLLAGAAHAQFAPYDYRLGAVRLTESPDAVVLHAEPPLTIEVLPGGRTWPPLTLSQAGDIHAGNTVIAARDGRVLAQAAEGTLLLPFDVRVVPVAHGYRIARGPAGCTVKLRAIGVDGAMSGSEALQRGRVAFASSPRGLVALVRRIGEHASETSYVAAHVDLRRCRITRTALGNPDFLVELGYSTGGGWWLTGSIEQTLLRSRDGRTWRSVRLPPERFSLIGSHVVSDREIWLAAFLGADLDAQAALVHTSDGGRHWHALSRTDPLLARVPAGWLEGQRRKAQAAMPLASASDQP